MLREYRGDDFVHMREWVNDPEVVDNLSDVFLYPHTTSETETFLNNVLQKEDQHRGFVIADLETEAYIGQIDLFKFDWKNRTAEMGIVIGSRSLRGKGYGTEAIRVLQKFVFDRLNMNRLQLEVHDFNEAAIRCYNRCGFREEGRMRERHFVNGHYSDTVLMAILRSDYMKLTAEETGRERL